MPILSKIGGAPDDGSGRPGWMTGSWSLLMARFEWQSACPQAHDVICNLLIGHLPWSARRAPSRRGVTGSRQMLRPIAGAMIRSSAISRSNCAGNIDCAPSLSA